MSPRARKRRRLIIQLAALVDLLFVVMFLQYTDQTRSAAEQSARLRLAAHHADELKEDVLTEQDNLRRKRDELQSEVDDLRKKLAKETYKNVDLEKQLREIGDVAKELIPGVDPESLRVTLREAPAGEVAVILDLLKDAKGKNAAQVVHMLRKSAEVRNWCDIWEVHLHEDSRTDAHVRVRAPNLREQSFRAVDKNEFAVRMMQIVKQAGEPKSLVIVMFTRGDAYLRPIDDVTKGLDQVQTIWSAQQPGKKIQVTTPRYSAQPP